MGSATDLRRAATARGVSVTELARRAGISRATTYRILDGATDPRVGELRELYLALGLRLELATSPGFDLDAAAAVRHILGRLPGEPASGVSAWVERLERFAHGDPGATIREAGAASSVWNAPGAVGLGAEHWTVDRLVSAGRASGRPWALSGWAALDAMGHEIVAPTVMWVEDVRTVGQLLADTMTPVELDTASVILVRGDESTFVGTIDVEGVVLVDPVQGLVDAVGLGGAARDTALTEAGRLS